MREALSSPGPSLSKRRQARWSRTSSPPGPYAMHEVAVAHATASKTFGATGHVWYLAHPAGLYGIGSLSVLTTGVSTQELPPEAGSVEVAMSPAGPAATQNELDVHETLASAPSEPTCADDHDDGPPAGSVEVNSSPTSTLVASISGV